MTVEREPPPWCNLDVAAQLSGHPLDCFRMNDDPVVITTVQGPAAANQTRLYLEANGVPTLIRGHAVSSLHPFTVDGMGEIQILVAPEHEMKARELLARVESGNQALDDDQDPEVEPGPE